MSEPEKVVIGNATLYMGDCRDVLPLLAVTQTIITDPVWPDAAVPLFGSDDPKGMLAAMFDAMPDLPLRVAIQLGCDSDPRFLTAVPSSLRLFRIAWLELVRMGYKGRLGMTGDVGYLFGVPPPAKPGQHIIPGRCTDPDPFGKQANHPCPRKLGHVRWLVKWWSADADVVLDPFMGSGTTGVACVDAGRKFIGIEVDHEYFDTACRRIDDAQRMGDMLHEEPAPKPAQDALL